MKQNVGPTPSVRDFNIDEIVSKGHTVRVVDDVWSAGVSRRLWR